MYTEIFVNVHLKKETPDEVIAVLKAMCADDDDVDRECLNDKPERWSSLFRNCSCYTPETSCANLINWGSYWSLLGKGDIKNYQYEIESFFEWLMPWMSADEGEFVGYMREEQALTPRLILYTKDLEPE